MRRASWSDAKHASTIIQPKSSFRFKSVLNKLFFWAVRWLTSDFEMKMKAIFGRHCVNCNETGEAATVVNLLILIGDAPTAQSI